MKIIDPEELPFDPARAVYPDGEAEPDDPCDSDRSYEVMEGVSKWGGRRGVSRGGRRGVT
jgi:hypothetical protein